MLVTIFFNLHYHVTKILNVYVYWTHFNNKKLQTIRINWKRRYRVEHVRQPCNDDIESVTGQGSLNRDSSISTCIFTHFCVISDLTDINLMPHLAVVCLGLIAYRPTRIALFLADCSKRISKDILEDVPDFLLILMDI